MDANFELRRMEFDASVQASPSHWVNAIPKNHSHR